MMVAFVPPTADSTMSRQSVSYTVSWPALCSTWWYFHDQFSCLFDGAPAAPASD
jgi:hypothetical protein